MNKNAKLYIIIAAGLLFVIALIAVVVSNAKPSNKVSSDIPTYILTPIEAQTITEVVKNFVALYNSYSTDDYSNLRSLGDLETVTFQQTMLDYIQKLQDVTPAGYNIRTNVDNVSLAHPEADTVIATVTGTVRETASPDPNTIPSVRTYTTTATVTFKKVGAAWLVDNITFQNH